MQTFTSPSQIKVGVIGYGGAFNMGRKHLEEMRDAGMTPCAVCEIDKARRAVAQEDFPGIETYRSLGAMLKSSDVNLIVHITPHNLHYRLAAQCIRAGRHVVTEKPFVLTTAEADRLITLADQHNVMVSTYHNRHWDGCALDAVAKVREQKLIGDVVRIEAHMGGYGLPGPWWRTSKSISGGILYDWGVHLLEYALQIVGDAKVTEVTAFAHHGYWESQAPADWPWRGDTNADDATAIVRFDTGVMLSLNVSQIRSEQRPGRIEVVGTKGTYILVDDGHWILRAPTGKDDKGKPVIEETTGQAPPGTQHLFYRNIADYLCGKADLIITPQWARRPIHILDLATRSIQQGKAQKARYG